MVVSCHLKGVGRPDSNSAQGIFFHCLWDIQPNWGPREGLVHCYHTAAAAVPPPPQSSTTPGTGAMNMHLFCRGVPLHSRSGDRGVRLWRSWTSQPL